MTVLLSEFITQVSTSLKRGTAYDSVIPYYIRRAARRIERKYSLNYMKALREFITNPASTNPEIVDLPETPFEQLKAIDFVRWKLDGDSSGTYEFEYLSQADPEELPNLVAGRPKRFWLENRTRMRFDAIPDSTVDDQPFTGQIYAWFYSDWPTNTAATHWLLNNADDLLEAETILQMRPVIRDKSMIEIWGELRKSAMADLIQADAEFENSNRREVMEPFRSTLEPGRRYA